jgi:hypothetical protein
MKVEVQVGSYDVVSMLTLQDHNLLDFFFPAKLICLRSKDCFLSFDFRNFVKAQYFRRFKRLIVL